MRRGSRPADVSPGRPSGKSAHRAGQIALDVDHGYALVNEANLHYVTAGEPDREAVVLLHGWPQTWFAWRKVIPLLARDYFVVAPDLPGLGESAVPAHGYTKRCLAHSIGRFLEGELHLPSFHLVGHDWGGPIAVHMAAENPASVRSLAILDVTLPESQRPWRSRAEHGTSEPTRLPPRRAAEPRTEREERTYLLWYYKYHCRTPGALDDAIDVYLECYLSPRAVWAGAAYRNTACADAHDIETLRSAGRIRAPILAIGGQSSRGAEVAYSMSTLGEDVTCVIFDDCGRFVPEERAEGVAAYLVEHFARSPKAPAASERPATPHRTAFA